MFTVSSIQESEISLLLVVKSRVLHRFQKQAYDYQGERWEGGRDGEFGTGLCTLWPLEWMVHKGLSYSTGNLVFWDDLSGTGN